jgi:serine/threonine protein kinase
VEAEYAPVPRIRRKCLIGSSLRTDYLVGEGAESSNVRGTVPLDKMIDGPLAVPEFLRVAAGIAKALGCLQAKRLVHRDIEPANVIVDRATGEAGLTGFGLASRLPRQRPAPEPPEVIAGTLAYMAPEQTGRMNRSIDSRSDLYSLGVTYYEMLVGGLLFTAGDAMEWIHCHTPKEKWDAVPGVYNVVVGDSSADTPLKGQVTLKSEFTANP